MRDWPKKPKPKYGRAVFLDRDGTINVDNHYPHQVQSLEFIPKAIEGLKILSALEYHVIIVANQAGIALGIFNREQMSEFNKEIRFRVENAGARIDGFYYCPHLEMKHLEPGMSACECSKPSPGMVKEASEDFQIDLTKSFFIGDRTTDIAAGESVGCVTILVKTGKAGEEEGALPITPQYFTENLYEAALIVKSHLDT